MPGARQRDATGQPVNALAFSDDGRWLARSGKEGRVVLHDRRTGKERDLYQHAKEAMRLVFGPGSKWLASAGARGDVAVHELPSGQRVHQLPSRFVPATAPP